MWYSTNRPLLHKLKSEEDTCAPSAFIPKGAVLSRWAHCIDVFLRLKYFHKDCDVGNGLLRSVWEWQKCDCLISSRLPSSDDHSHHWFIWVIFLWLHSAAAPYSCASEKNGTSEILGVNYYWCVYWIFWLDWKCINKSWGVDEENSIESAAYWHITMTLRRFSNYFHICEIDYSFIDWVSCLSKNSNWLLFDFQVSSCTSLDKAIVMCEAGSGRAEERVNLVFENMKVSFSILSWFSLKRIIFSSMYSCSIAFVLVHILLLSMYGCIFS